jgi:hypothetical protein
MSFFRKSSTALVLVFLLPKIEKVPTYSFFMLSISVESFLRAPRGGYDRSVQYKLTWEPIEGNSPQISPNIFYYDYSGSQLRDNGDLTYRGQIPLWKEDQENQNSSLIFCNSW